MGHGVLCSLAAPRTAALMEDNNTLTLDLSLGYTLREPSAIVQRQILLCGCYASTTQYLGITAVSGRRPAVFRADVNSLFMSFPWRGMLFCLRLVWFYKGKEATV